MYMYMYTYAHMYYCYYYDDYVDLMSLRNVLIDSLLCITV